MSEIDLGSACEIKVFFSCMRRSFTLSFLIGQNAGGKTLILQASSPAISATLFDSSQAQRLQNQSICAWIVCRFNLYRSFLSLRYRRSMAGLSQRARSTSSCRRRYHEHRHMHDNTPADFYYVLFQVAADTREEKVLPGALGHGACLGSLHTCGGQSPS